jgi:hypothetical protein
MKLLEMPAMCETPNADALMRPEIRLYEAQKAFWNAQKNNVKGIAYAKSRTVRTRILRVSGI